MSAVILGDYEVTGRDGNVRFPIENYRFGTVLDLFIHLYGENRHLSETG